MGKSECGKRRYQGRKALLIPFLFCRKSRLTKKERVAIMNLGSETYVSERGFQNDNFEKEG